MRIYYAHGERVPGLATDAQAALLCHARLLSTVTWRISAISSLLCIFSFAMLHNEKQKADKTTAVATRYTINNSDRFDPECNVA